MGITEEMRETIKQMYSAGYTTGEIARELDIPEVIVVRVVGKY